MSHHTRGDDFGAHSDDPEQDALRARFRPLLIQNPNFFGNLEDSPFEPQLELVANTSYESIGCVGYHPQREQLHAVVYIHRRTGYGGGICSDGSTEYVRFYLSYDGGSTWEDQGVSWFDAYDIPENRSRLEYAVTRNVDPPRRLCFFPNLIQARAILSWNVVPPPDEPDYRPVWGEVHDTHIEVDPLDFVVVDDLVQAGQIELKDEVFAALDVTAPLPMVKKPLSLTDRLDLYRQDDIEPHRAAFPELQAMALNAALAPQLQAGGVKELFPGIDIDLSEIGDLLAPVDGNTTYEELECIGYDQRSTSMVGVIRLKRPSGYGGGPCTAGSTQYVTFWADVNRNGTFETCLGTATVDVNDYRSIPREGLEYSVTLRTDLDRLQRPCEQGPVLIPIRAILSWSTPAPCGNPDYVPVWGNREETIIHIPAGPRVSGSLPVVSTVGDMAVSDIDGAGYATGLGVETSFVAETSPFGGRIDIAGKIVGGTSSSRYRVMVKPSGAPDSAYVPITNEPSGLQLTLITVAGGVVTIDTNHVVHADADGYFPYEDYSDTHFVEGNRLMRWHTGALEHGSTYDLRVDLRVDANPANDIHSDVVAVRIDNQGPNAELDINLGAGVECGDFVVGEEFSGTFSATDEHFRNFSFVVLPGGPANGALPDPASGAIGDSIGGVSVGGGGIAGATYTFDTQGMDPCGYSLTLRVWSRTNVNSGLTRRRADASVGFCVQAP